MLLGCLSLVLDGYFRVQQKMNRDNEIREMIEAAGKTQTSIIHMSTTLHHTFSEAHVVSSRALASLKWLAYFTVY